MNLRTLSFKNVRHSRGRYLAYVFSAAFSVAVFFLYTALAEHPDLRGGYTGAGYVRTAMEGAAVVIFAFAFLFLLYSGAAFARFRMKEFGLLALFGLTRPQMMRIVLWENLIVAVSALALGLGAGALFLKLFFMAASAVLGLSQELPAVAGPEVWLRTVVAFGSIFLVVSLASMRHLVRSKIIDQIRAERKPKASPAFSRWRAVAGALLVAGGYAWASFPAPIVVVAGVVPVTVVVSLGTFLLMREGSIAILSALRRSESLFYRPLPFLVVSQLRFKIQENYRALSAVALLVAAILSSVGTVFSVYMEVGEDAAAGAPHAIQVAAPAASADADIAAVEAVLARHRTGLAPARAEVLRGSLGELAVNVLSESAYRGLYRPAGAHIRLETDESAVLVLPSTYRFPAWPEGVRQTRLLAVNGEEAEIELVPDYSGALLNQTPDLVGGLSVVVSDRLFARLLEASPRESVVEVAAWSGPGWQAGAVSRAIDDLRAELHAGAARRLTTTLEARRAAIQSPGFALFVGVVISLVFFASACSLLYFRLFTEVDEDRRYFRKLLELGMEPKGIRRLSRAICGVVFVVPFLVGLVHSTFAMRALGTLMMRTVLHWGWTVALAYLAVYLGYFAATHALYWQVAGGAARGEG